MIISSGGTTGVPKGSCRSFAAYGAMVVNPSPADRRQLVNGKLAYLSQVLVDTTLLGGGTVVLRDFFDADDTLAAIEDERITDLFLVEPQLFELMDHPDVDSTDLSSLRAVVHIGASAPPTLRRRARESLGPVVAHTYGASEIGIVSALSPAEHDPAHPERFTCAGRIHPGVDVRFRRPDGTLAEDGEEGSIEVRSPAMAAGYGHRPVEQSAAFRDGWYRTGDLGQLDDEGYLHILGRAVDITWTEGVMISPTLIQDTLCRVPGVRYAVVVTDPETAARVAAVSTLAGLGRRRRRLPGCRRHGARLQGRRQPRPRPAGPVPRTERASRTAPRSGHWVAQQACRCRRGCARWLRARSRPETPRSLTPTTTPASC